MNDLSPQRKTKSQLKNKNKNNKTPFLTPSEFGM